jgi:hypothetical protein
VASCARIADVTVQFGDENELTACAPEESLTKVISAMKYINGTYSSSVAGSTTFDS